MDISLERLDETIEYEVLAETDEFVSGRQEYMIGRAQDCDLRLQDPFVSRHHCELIVDPETHAVRIRDLGSENGTFVDCEPVIADRDLRDGDHLLVAGIPFEVHIREHESA